ncbi:glycosyltransferase [Carnobacteriaceae bacterium zg-ZUI240]|nr:glycosyltransferase [Carnobacteriaceae bacterium zg-ZUI240]
MSKVLSVVVPSYNAAQYLNETIPTMLAANNSDALEIIIVNDGSKDNTSEVAHALKEQYPDVIRVVDKENGGHGSTINAGIDVAKGKYFKVIDADDWVDSKAFEQLINFLATHDVDEVITPYLEVYMGSDTTQLVASENVVEKQVYPYDEFLKIHGQLPQMHMVTIKTDILKNNHIRIGEKMFYVDMEYIMFPSPYIETVVYLNEVVYQYRLGTVTQSVSVGSFVRNRHMHEQVILRVVDFFNRYETDTYRKEVVKQRILTMVDRHAKVLLAMSDVQLAKREFIALEQRIKEKSEQMHADNPSKVVSFVRMGNYAGFNLMSVIVRLRNKLLKRQ